MPKISVKQIHPDTRNANHCVTETLDTISRNVKRTGLYPDLIVRPHPEISDEFMMVDGHHRLKILIDLGYEEVSCQIWEISDEEVRIALLTLNRLRGTDNVKKRAELIESLTHTFSLPDLASLLPETEAQIKDMLGLLRFEEEQLEKCIREQVQAEQDSLPVPYTFMILPADVPIVDQALAQFQGEGMDRGATLVKICQALITIPEVQNNGEAIS